MHRQELRAALRGIVDARVAPPVPAAARVDRAQRACGRLRVEHHDAVRVGPALITRLPGKRAADCADALPASMERDVNAALLALRAVFGHEQKAGVRHRGEPAACDETGLPELAQRARDAA